MLEFSLERHTLYRPSEVSRGVLRRGGFRWAMSRPQHRQENGCLPPTDGGHGQHDRKVFPYGVGIDRHSKFFVICVPSPVGREPSTNCPIVCAVSCLRIET